MGEFTLDSCGFCGHATVDHLVRFDDTWMDGRHWPCNYCDCQDLAQPGSVIDFDAVYDG